VPLFDGTHRLGAMQITVSQGTDLPDPAVERVHRLLTQVAGHLVAAVAGPRDLRQVNGPLATRCGCQGRTTGRLPAKSVAFG